MACKFQDLWLHMVEFKDWLSKAPLMLTAVSAIKPSVLIKWECPLVEAISTKIRLATLPSPSAVSNSDSAQSTSGSSFKQQAI